MKNYYEILEISSKASQEMVGKAYKVLVKRYHPDLQASQEAKEKCEVKIKEINEAYDVIGNEQKRKEYDAKLEVENQRINNSQNQNYDQNQSSNKNYNQNQSQNYVYNNNKYTASNSSTNTNSNINTASYNSIRDIHARAQERMRQRQTQNQQKEKIQQEVNQQYQKDYQDAIKKAYHDAYIQDLKNRGYKIKYKKTFNDYLRSMIALLITIGIIAIIVQIPFVKNFLHSLYEENPFIRGIVNSIANLFR